ncbi:MAG: restriction endonuclease, partial [Syntrophales bacterium]|nr:restriction endonuclease [Syntrophales bacterium]
MLIEVVKLQDAPNADKGNLLEELAAEFLKTQGYEVSRQVRVTASELDLLCKHKVSGKDIYVECKAHRDSLSANVLTNLLGTVDFHEYSEGWLVSTGPLGKDAKGFMEQWEKKKPEKRGKLSIYTPDRVLNALLDAKVITHQPNEKGAELIR